MRTKLAKLLGILAITSFLVTGCSNSTNTDKPDIFDGTDEPPVVEHTHTYSDVWSRDERTHWHASTCEHTGLRKDEAEHTFTVVETPATYESEGSRVYTCSVCFYSKTETIDKLTHSYSTSWEHDHYNHWHACTDEGYENAKKDLEEHTFVVETVDATFESTGLKTSTCKECGYSYSVEIPKLSHEYSKEWEFDGEGHWHYCVDEGYGSLTVDYAKHNFKKETKDPTYDDVGLEIYTCQECEYSYSVEIDKLEHKYSSNYSSDDKGHWHACTDKGYETLQNDYHLHNYKKEVVESTFDKKGYTIYTCEDCGYKYVDDETEKIEHNHADEWTNDAWGHWHACTDEGYSDLKIDYAQHDYESAVTKEAGYYENGVITRTCSECGFSYTTKLESLYNQSVNSLTYQLVDNEYYCVTYIPRNLEVVFIPDEYEGLPVRKMNNYLLSQNTKELHLGKNIDSVYRWDLNGNTPLLEVLEINDYFTEIPYYIQNLDNLKTIYLGKNVSYIDTYSVSQCKSLENVFISEDNQYFTSIDGGIYNKDKTVIYFYSKTEEGAAELPDTVTTISSYAFQYAKISSIEIPESVSYISDYAFYSCKNLETITLPRNLKNLYYYAFAECENLKEVTLNFDNLYGYSDEIFYNDTNIETVHIGQFFCSFNNQWFKDSHIKEIVIDDNNHNFRVKDGLLLDYTEYYLYSAFNYTGKDLTELPTTVRYLYSYSFANTGIENVAITDDLYFDDGIFMNCHNLTEADLSKSTRTYFYRTFENCENLKKVILPTIDSEINISYNMFRNCSSLETIEGLSRVTNVYSSSFDGCDQLYKTDNGIKYIGDSANQYYIAVGYADDLYKNNDTIKPHDNCKIISEYAFNNVDSRIKKVDFNHVKTIGNYSFAYREISEIDFGDSVEYIYGQAFEGIKLVEIQLPDTLKTIDYNAFSYCQNLTTISIGKNTSYINGSAFAYSYNLSNIEVDSENERYFIYKDGLYDKQDKTLIFNFSTEDYAIIWEETRQIYWYFTDCNYRTFNTVFYESTSNNIWSNNYTTTKYYNASKYYYSETNYTGRWHYVEGVPTLW